MPAWALPVGIDDFEDGTTAGWHAAIRTRTLLLLRMFQLEDLQASMTRIFKIQQWAEAAPAAACPS